MIANPRKKLFIVQAYEDAEPQPEPKRPLCLPEKAQWHTGVKNGMHRGFWFWLDLPQTMDPRRYELIARTGLPFYQDVDAQRAMAQ